MVRELTGVNAVRGVEALALDLTGAGLVRPPGPVLYTPLSPSETGTDSRDERLSAQARRASDPWDGQSSRESRFRSLIAARVPQLEVHDLSPILDALRTIKSPREIALIRRATRIAGLAIIEAMRSTRPGVAEYQLDAAAKYVFYVQGARGDAYASIIGGGRNAYLGHYFRKADLLRDGDMVLMDYAPDYRYYTSDVTRMWPVNGRYTDEQRQLSDFILAYRDALFRQIRPGTTSDAVVDGAAREMRRYLDKTPFRNPAHQKAAEDSLLFRGHFQHPVGMAVHDVGKVRGVALQPGMVFTIDPMLWVHEEQRYVRMEDVVVVTTDGAENLSAFVPATTAEIERTMREPGLVQLRPATP
jgi:Xaa-Pro aminopeptidase